jgi:hypothetical protein
VTAVELERVQLIACRVFCRCRVMNESLPLLLPSFRPLLERYATQRYTVIMSCSTLHA